jgi:hypothetical protein
MEDKTMRRKKSPKSKKKALKKVALKPIKTLTTLQVPGIVGESTSSRHEGWIEIF